VIVILPGVTVTKQPSLPLTLVVGGFCTFALIGALQAMYGPTLFSFQSRFGIDNSTANLIFSAFFAGVVTAIVALGALEQRVSRATSLTAALGLLGVGSLGVGLAPAWWVALVSASGIGLGYGLSVLNYNTLFATGFGSRSTAFVNLLNAAWSVGAILGPVAVGLSSSDQRLPFLVAGMMGLMFAPLGLSARTTNPDGFKPTQGTPSATIPPWTLMLMFACVMWLYTGTEVGIGAHEPRHLNAVFGYSPEQAAFLSSLFWLGQAVGRVLVAPISLRVREDVIVVACLALAGCAVALAHVGLIAPIAYALCGVFLGPIFPSVLVWFNRFALGSIRATSILLASANVGGMVFPPLIAALTTNAALIPTVVLAFTAANAVLAFTLKRRFS
jgi:fucose permease